MSPSVILFLSALLPFGHPQIVTNRYLIPAWHVDARRDRFSGGIACRVYQGPARRPTVIYQRSTLAFAFPKSRNTLNAAFQVDGGYVRPWSSVYPTLVGTGATLSGRSMTNPTEGLVLLPTSILMNATTVTIRAWPNERPRTFTVLGLAGALTAARGLGCDPYYGFAR